ncbi:MAG: rRNA small subunit methyltransferase 1, partial [Oscillospiraceae bacterium]|nr:rRNA small subunit methyltransferase 1 [Oscillospiraceae bacterium]
MNGILYVTGTPIGNLEDITLRQLRILQEVDFIAAEDTRVTRKLLTHFEIRTELVSYHEHSDRNVIDGILNRIASGQNCAIVTDAGMPCISDPGETLVRACYERGISVQAVPGASAVITALSVCGGSTRQFV